jgi:hypothetical protein
MFRKFFFKNLNESFKMFSFWYLDSSEWDNEGFKVNSQANEHSTPRLTSWLLTRIFLGIPQWMFLSTQRPIWVKRFVPEDNFRVAHCMDLDIISFEIPATRNQDLCLKAALSLLMSWSRIIYWEALVIKAFSSNSHATVPIEQKACIGMKIARKIAKVL